MAEGPGWTASLLAAAAVHAAVAGGVGLFAPRATRVAPPLAAAVEVSFAAAAPPQAAPAAPVVAVAAVAAGGPAVPVAEPAAAAAPPQTAPAAPVVAVAAVAAGGPAPAVAEPAAAGRPAAFSRPRPLRAPAPAYPAGARRRGEQGTVTCLVRVGADGRVEQATVSASSGWRFLDGAAIQAIEQTPFAPARAGATPVAAELVVKVRFDLVGVSVDMAAPR